MKKLLITLLLLLPAAKAAAQAAPQFDGSGNMKVSVNAALAAGSNVIGHVIVDSGTIAVTGTFWQTTQPISAASMPLPSFAATSTKQSDGTQKTQIVDGSGNVIASSSNALNVNIAGGGSAVVTEAATETAGTANTASVSAYIKAFDGTTFSRLRSRAGLVSSADIGLVVRPFMGSDGTNTMPTMDAAARAGFHSPAAAASGGASVCYLTSAASTNSTNCDVNPGTVYSIQAVNTSSTNYFLRMYNLASAPTCSSSTGFLYTIPVLGAAANGGGISAPIGAVGQNFSTGIGFCLTGGGSSTDNTNAATGVYIIINYK